MKRLSLSAFLFVFAIHISFAQSEDHNTPVIGRIDAKEQRAVIKKVEKEEKKATKAEKAQKKEEKKRKQEEKLTNAIGSRRKAISKNEKKIVGIQQKLTKGTEKGKLSPSDIEKMNVKIEKLKSIIIRDKEKLAKLHKKK